MDPITKDYLIDFYSKNLMLHGDRPEALRWTKEGQRQRYSSILQIAPSLDNKRILDYGCGKGDLYAYMKDNGIQTEYVGVDINPELISLASKKYPECEFFVMDIEEEELKEEFDYIFVCGVYNNLVEGAYVSLRNATARLFRSAREGLAVSALTVHSTNKGADVTYIDPGDLLNYCAKHITPYLSLHHAYAPDDLLLFLYRHPHVPAGPSHGRSAGPAT